VVAALEGVLAPYAAVVLVERPGHKRPRRCEVVANESGRIDDAERMRFVSLLEDSLVWDGYLFAQVRAQYSPHAPCVWHVLNNETFPLAAEHAASVLLYLEALQPSQWIDSDFDAVVRAPGLDGM
jgi:hypothetical protein